MMDRTRCPLCSGSGQTAGEKPGCFRSTVYRFRRCETCRFLWVENADTDYANLYNDAYYEGRGADPLVNYAEELSHPELSVRRYEWAGILDAVSRMRALTPATDWLDFGCGAGGLVRHVRAHSPVQICGAESGAIASRARENGIPIFREDEIGSRTFDVITAIEVLEHVEDPLATLRWIAAHLKPGGLFFYTTGNLEPFWNSFLNWAYCVPEIHISYWTPTAMGKALKVAGLTPMARKWNPGFGSIYAFKILKTLRRSRREGWQAVVPWGILGRLADARYRLTDLTPAEKGPGTSQGHEGY